MATDYDKQIQKIADTNFPRICLGDQVSTPDGGGIVVSLSMSRNGSNIQVEIPECTVWFGTEKHVKVEDLCRKHILFGKLN